MTDPTPAATPLSQGDAGAQQVVRERGGCGEFLPNNRICILPSGHPQPHGEPAASEPCGECEACRYGNACTTNWKTEPSEPMSAGGPNLELCARAAFMAFSHDVQRPARWEDVPEDMRVTFRMVADAVLIAGGRR